jgi:surface polysaccharide O-acyltransferase-like enzyme
MPTSSATAYLLRQIFSDKASNKTTIGDKMKPTKYILILFIAMFLGKCLTPLALSTLSLSLTSSVLYITLIPIMYLLLLLGDFLLNRMTNAVGTGNWIEISERGATGGERLFGADVVRFFAIISVPAIHFMGLTGYYDTPLEGGTMFLATALRWLFICCVPVFLTLTGFFKSKKGIDLSHYKSIAAVLATHIFITCIRLWVDHRFLGVPLSREYIADKLVYFEYGWYVKLYIGIMLLIPFFNVAWNYLSERWHKELLIVTLIFLCSMGPITAEIVPSSWLILYVFIFYFIGAYLSEYEICINKLINVLLIIAMLIITALGCFGSPTESGCFDWSFAAYSANSGYSALPTVILTFLIVVLLMDIDIDFKPLNLLLCSFSVVSLEMYMFSQMFDSLIYPKLEYNGFIDIFVLMPFIVGKIVILSYAAAHLKRIVFIIFTFPLRILHKK